MTAPHIDHDGDPFAWPDDPSELAVLRRQVDDLAAENRGLTRQIRVLRARNASTHRQLHDELVLLDRAVDVALSHRGDMAKVAGFARARAALGRAVQS